MLLNLLCFLSGLCCSFVAVTSELSFFLKVLACLGAFLGSFVVFFLLAWGFLGICCAFVNYDKPQESDSPFFRKMTGLYIDLLIRLLRVRIHTTGLEKLPKDGRFLMVCNHTFVADPAILLHVFKDSQLAFISKQENRKLPFVGKLMHKLQCQLIDRDNDRQALRSIINCINIIKEDRASIAVFPEGGIIKDGQPLHHFRSGVFKIATKTKVPIVVLTLQNTRPIIQNGLKLKGTDVELHLVDVIQPEEFAEMKTTELGEKIYEIMLADLTAHPAT